MKRQVYYKFLGFLTSDYKAYEAYLEELASKGYELVGVGPAMMGQFKKIQPTVMRYYVDIVPDEGMENYIALCEESGWQLVSKIGQIKIFKEKEGFNPLPIHTDPQIESNNIIHALLKSEGWMILWTPIWIWISFKNLTHIKYTDLLDNLSLLIPLVYLLIAVAYMLYSSMMGIYIWRLKKGSLINSKLWYPTVRAAKVRRNIYFGLLGALLCVIIASLFDNGIGMLMMVGFIVGMLIITALIATYYRRVEKTFKAKCILVGGTVVTFLVLTFGGMQLSLMAHLWSRENPEYVQNKVEKIQPLSIKDFPGYEACEIERSWIDSGKSIAVKEYYEYQEYLVGDGDLEVNYYEFANLKATDFYLEGMLERGNRYEYDGWSLNRVDVHLFNVDEVYANKDGNSILLKDENKILSLESRNIKFFDSANRKVIEEALKR